MSSTIACEPLSALTESALTRPFIISSACASACPQQSVREIVFQIQFVQYFQQPVKWDSF